MNDLIPLKTEGIRWLILLVIRMLRATVFWGCPVTPGMTEGGGMKKPPGMGGLVVLGRRIELLLQD